MWWGLVEDDLDEYGVILGVILVLIIVLLDSLLKG